MPASIPTLEEIIEAIRAELRPIREELERLRAEAERPLTVADAAERLGISKRTLQRRIRDGSIPAVKIGGVVRIHPRDIATSDDDLARIARRTRGR